MDLLGIKKVEAGRNNGVGMWVQEVGKSILAFVMVCIAHRFAIFYSLEGLLQSCSSCLPTRFNGKTVQ